MASRSAVLSVVALALAFSVAACGGDDKDAKGTSPSASASASLTPSASATPLDPASGLPTDQPAGALPSSFPTAAVPVLPGPVTQPIGEGSAEQGWVLELELAKKADDCFTAAATALVEHGFTQQPGATDDNGHREALFNSATYAVIISTSKSDTGGCRLGYEVGKLSK